MKQKNIVLMVVAVGCGLVAAFLTSQMGAKPVDQMEVVVAAKDIPVGTMLTKDELKGAVKIVKRPKEGLPPTVVLNPEELVDKRLSRPIRAEEVINSQDLSKGGVITLPEGHDMVSLQVGAGNAAAGFVGPGSRVNVIATLRLGNKLEAFPLLVNMLVVAVGTETTYSKEGSFPNLNMVSFAVKEKEALLLSLAKSRGCTIELMLRHPGKSTEGDKAYSIDEVIKKLSDEKEKSVVSGAADPGNGRSGEPGTKPVEPATPVVPPKMDMGNPMTAPMTTPMVQQPAPMVKVLVAKQDIAPNTEITKDLIADLFEEKTLPKEFAGNAMGDLTEALGKYLKTGVAKDQWVTPSMVGLQATKVKPPEEFVPKPPVVEPKAPTEDPKPVAQRKFHDVTIHTANGTTVLRYEEVAPGKWKKIAEMTPEQAARDNGSAPKDEPKAEPEKKRD